MKTALALTALMLSLTACTGDDGSNDVATDPNGNGGGGGDTAMPTEAPTPPGQVRTYNLATVMDTGTPQLCLGAVAESYPPQCGGPDIVNWDWDVYGHDMYDQEGDIRWGTYVVTGRWNGDTFEVTENIPGPLYDPGPVEPTPTPSPAVDYTDKALEEIAEQLFDELPGVLGAYGGEGSEDHVLVDVYYDDGTLQDWADEHYGAGVVLISSALVDV